MVLTCVLVGCGPEPLPQVVPVTTNIYQADPEFKDDVQSNVQIDEGEFTLSFKDIDGNTVNIQDYREKKNVLLVMTRGFNGIYCPYCTAQTSRFMNNMDKFNYYETEVIVVFPGPSSIATPFRNTVLKKANLEKVPFPLVVDEDFKVVDQLKLRADLAAPSTFILDKQGHLRFAYVGKDNADRPSLQAILDQLELIQKGT